MSTEKGEFILASRNTLDMTSGPIFRKLLLFAYPLMINSIVNTLYNIADKIIAGQYIGDGAIAAVGACAPPINLLVNTVIAIASGGSVLCGNFIGARKDKELRECMHCIPVAGALFGFLLCLVGLLCGKPLLMAMDTPESILADAYLYMSVRMLGMIFGITNSFCVTIFTAHGDTKRITLSGLLSGLLNVLGNLFFVIVIPMGIAGIALATVLSQVLALGIKIIILFSNKDSYRLQFKALRIYPQHLVQIFRIGIPTGINSVCFSLSNVILQSSVNSFGDTVITGNSGADTIAELVALFPTRMNEACSCAVAQCYGAKNFPRIKETVRKALFGTVAMTIFSGTMVTILAMPIMKLFTDSATVAQAGIPKLMFTTWGYLIYVFSLIYAGSLKGIRHSGVTMLLNVVGICLPRVLWVWFVFPFFNTPTMLYMIYPISYLISAVLLGIAYRIKLKSHIQMHTETLTA